VINYLFVKLFIETCVMLCFTLNTTRAFNLQWRGAEKERKTDISAHAKIFNALEKITRLRLAVN
jgi:hypothetical protein